MIDGRACLLALAIFGLGGCNATNSHTATLYRNSPLDMSIRVEWASFRANESDAAYNIRNCEMAASLLNANLAELAKEAARDQTEGLGFWCEPGDYREKGSVPAAFTSKFPADV